MSMDMTIFDTTNMHLETTKIMGSGDEYFYNTKITVYDVDKNKTTLNLLSESYAAPIPMTLGES